MSDTTGNLIASGSWTNGYIMKTEPVQANTTTSGRVGAGFIYCFKDGSLGPGHRDEFCQEHATELLKPPQDGGFQLKRCGQPSFCATLAFQKVRCGSSPILIRSS